MTKLIIDHSICEIEETTLEDLLKRDKSSMRSVQIWSFHWSVFSCVWTEYRDLLRKSPHSVRIKENTDQKKLRI